MLLFQMWFNVVHEVSGSGFSPLIQPHLITISHHHKHTRACQDVKSLFKKNNPHCFTVDAHGLSITDLPSRSTFSCSSDIYFLR